MLKILEICFAFFFSGFSLAVLLGNQKRENRKLRKKIKLYEEQLFISDKELAEDSDFLEALSCLDKEFPG